MIKILSKLVALILTIAIAIVLYPICAVFYIFKLIGQVSSVMFGFTNNLIAKLWSDIKEETMHN